MYAFRFPAWSGTTVYRHNEKFEYLGTRVIPGNTREIMQLASDEDGFLYTANWGQRSCAKTGPFPESTSTIWTASFDRTIAAVAFDKDFVYCLPSDNSFVYVLRQSDGVLMEQRNLGAASATGTYGGVFVVKDKLYYTRGSQLLRYDVSTGKYDGFIMSLTYNPSNMFFKDDSICATEGWFVLHLSFRVYKLT